MHFRYPRLLKLPIDLAFAKSLSKYNQLTWFPIGITNLFSWPIYFFLQFYIYCCHSLLSRLNRYHKFLPSSARNAKPPFTYVLTEICLQWSKRLGPIYVHCCWLTSNVLTAWQTARCQALSSLKSSCRVSIEKYRDSLPTVCKRKQCCLSSTYSLSLMTLNIAWLSG